MEYDEEVELDVLIIGAGGAGVRTAIELVEHGVDDILVVGKRGHGDAHTVKAAGGINAALGNLDPEDRWDIHAADTLKEGHYLNQPEAVEMLCKNVPDRVQELKDWGCDFNETEDGKINQRYFGAQAYRRTCFVGDHTGDAILKTLVDKAKDLDVPYRDNVYITKLLGDKGKVAGAFGIDFDTGNRVLFKATAVVLAAGGYSQIYKRSSSRDDENTGDGPALALDAGVPLRDMEMVQFHPTGMVYPEEKEGSLVTEAVRGEGGKLFNAKGERFMEKYSPQQMELDARDVVARANYQEIQEGRGTERGGVYLDISHKSKEFIKERLPSMYEKLLEYNDVDISEERMEVAPTSHYSMGGVKIDFETGQTSMEGLFAVGEVTAGLHGGNRLGGNSLAEIVTFGTIFGGHIAEYVGDAAQEPVPDEQVEDHVQDLEALQGDGTHNPYKLVEELRTLMWDHAGIIRDAERMKQGLEKIDELQAKAEDLDVSMDLIDESVEWALNLQFMLPVAETVLKSALKREESRAAHYREDFPDKDPDWECNIVAQQNEKGEITLHTEDVPPVPRAIQKAIEEEHELDYHHLE